MKTQQRLCAVIRLTLADIFRSADGLVTDPGRLGNELAIN
jgi:hypothetical protein